MPVSSTASLTPAPVKGVASVAAEILQRGQRVDRTDGRPTDGRPTDGIERELAFNREHAWVRGHERNSEVGEHDRL